jgi:dihydrofolate synthase / folylpolyglutamate synthase
MTDQAATAGVRRIEEALQARHSESHFEPSIDRIVALADLLGNPQRGYPVIHITGTNGKTTTARMVEALLRALGLRTGRFTSPHVESVTERIAIDGHEVDASQFVRAYDDIAPYVAMLDERGPAWRPSYFEVLTAMAFAAFADAPVDAAVLEVGMGGSWDATNVADAQVAVITPVAVDHVEYLGDSLAGIAAEKAGIVKPEAFAVLAQQPIEAAEAILRRVAEVEATVAREGLEFGVLHRSVALGGQMMALRGLAGAYEEIFLPLHGAHQAHNAVCALAAVEAFVGGGTDPLDIDTVRAALAAVTSPGRLEVVRRGPTVLLDAAHNPASAAAATAAIRDEFSFTQLVGVVGILADKDARGILNELEPILAEVVVSQSSSPRALPVDELAAVAVEVFGADRVEVAPRLDDAIDAGVRLAEEAGDLGGAGVLVTGSITTVGEARRLLRRPAGG